jgi:hypothetical protein
MHARKHVGAIVLSIAILVAAGTAAANGSTGGRGAPTSAAGPCPTVSAARMDGRSRLAPTAAIAGTALSEYDDFIEDVVSAPDICAANLVTNDNVWMTIGTHIHDRTEFDGLDAYRIYVDRDADAATGAPPEAGPLPGADLVIGVADPTSTLSAWDGVAFTAVSPQPEILSGWADGYGPVLRISRAALGSPSTLRLVMSTGNGTDHDLAPDFGSWSYVVTPLRLAPGRLVTSRARAGAPLAAALEVTRSDFDIPLDEGRIACRANVAGRTIVGRGRFADELVTCVWRVPRGTTGKRISGSVAVTFQGVTAKRAFSMRVT